MLQIRQSRSGRATAVYDGVALHSAHDPEREARRFVLAATSAEAPGTVVVLGEGLGYLARAVRSLHPGARLLVIYHATELWANTREVTGTAWHPGAGPSLEQFLRASLSELDVEGLRVLEWPPSVAAFPAQSRRALEATAQIVRELNGTVATTVKSGRRWLRNSILNYLLGPDPLAELPVQPGRPVLIAAAGPSLADASALLRRLRGRANLWALPSAVEHLLAVGVEPDLVVLTDAVYYSMCHLHAARGREPAIAMPLSAAPGAWRVSSRIAYLVQPSFHETPLVASFGPGMPSCPPHGTVAATALELALQATSSHGVPVVLAGLDLCYRDVLSHCRPNAFEHFLAAATRLTPLHHELCAAALTGAPIRLEGSRDRTSLPLQTYAGWFAAGSPRWSGRVRRLSPSPVELPALPSISPEELERICPPYSPAARLVSEERRALPRPARIRLILELVGSWRACLRSAASSPLAGSDTAIEIARALALRELLDMRRRARLGQTAGVREAWNRLLADVDAFLASLEELAERARDA